MVWIDALRAWRWKIRGHQRRPVRSDLFQPLRGARVLEIGGPSGVFGGDGLCPVYPAAAAVDCVQWSADTAWHDRQDEGVFSVDGVVLGRLHVIDDVTLAPIPDSAYDAVISSHVIEHIANPLRALSAWRRVARADGTLLMVAPHAAGTFDHRRAITPLEHLVADAEAGVGEDDLTHLAETFALHDHRRDGDPDDRATWEAKRRDNVRHRLLHHHVFSAPSLVRLLDHAGVQVHALEVRWPHDIYVLGRFAAGRPDNARWLEPRHPALRRSPFPIDRSASR